MSIRLDKYLADMSIGTRREVKQMMAKGLVTVDGEIIKKPETKVDIERQRVICQGEIIGYEAYEYYLLNKPAGTVSATSDKKEKTVLDLIESKKRKDLFPVGRLDKDTEGLLLITNDGMLSHHLLSPKRHVDKVYYAKIDGHVSEKEIKIFAEGLDIGEKENTLPARLVILKADSISEIELTIREGKFHQVKRMFEAVGMEVTYLKRIRMGCLVLDTEMAVGEYRCLTEKELEELKQC